MSPLALGAIAALLPCLAGGQETIVFSKPADVKSDKANTFMGPSNRELGTDAHKAPRSIFTLPEKTTPRFYFFQQADPAALEKLNKRKNWMLLTPEQLMGIQTPEEIMRLPDPTGESHLSLEQQFLLRESRNRGPMATNIHSGMAAVLGANPGPFTTSSLYGEKDFHTGRQPLDTLQSRQMNGVRVPFTGPFNEGRLLESSELERQADYSMWRSVFYQPQTPKVTPEQIASMERFRALMEPTTMQDTTPAIANRRTEPSKQPVAPASSGLIQRQPVFNPVGRDAVRIEDNIARPTGVKPLPGVSTKPPAPPAKRAEWQPQPPPWLTDKPKPHDNFNRRP